MNFASLPTQNGPDAVSIFYDQGFSTGATPTMQTWVKPKWANMVFLFCLGSGSSGAGGTSRASLAASIGAGGGGGACSGSSRLLIPAIYLPNQLYIQVGPARAGGAPGAAGLVGINSSIGVTPSTTAAAGNLLLVSNNGNPGAPAIAGTTGAAGGAAGIAVSTGQLLGHLGQWSASTGASGGAGSISAAPAVSINAMPGFVLTGGTGGGGSAASADNLTAGGSINAAGPIPFQSGGIASGGQGRPGFWSWAPLCGTGGTGGGSNPTGVGGAGGNGAYGCGGGGGGMGTTGGRGGNSGGGLVLIACF